MKRVGIIILSIIIIVILIFLGIAGFHMIKFARQLGEFHILRGIEQYLSRESVYQLQEQFKKESLGIGDSIEVHIYSAPLDESTVYEDLLDRGCMPRSLPMHKTEYDRIIREGMGVATRDIDYLEMDHICSRESSGLWYYKASEITESNGSFFIGQHELIIFLDNAKILIYAKVVI